MYGPYVILLKLTSHLHKKHIHEARQGHQKMACSDTSQSYKTACQPFVKVTGSYICIHVEDKYNHVVITRLFGCPLPCTVLQH